MKNLVLILFLFLIHLNSKAQEMDLAYVADFEKALNNNAYQTYNDLKVQYKSQIDALGYKDKYWVERLLVVAQRFRDVRFCIELNEKLIDKSHTANCHCGKHHCKN